MKVEKFKVLLYLKKSGTDKSGKAPIMGRITVNRTMAQFGCKLSCRPDLWNARESRLDGKSREGYYYMRKTLGEFIPWQFKTKDIAFGQLTEQFIHDYQNYVMDVKGLAVDTVRHYLAILKKVCRPAW